jgi:regulator of cell morphogenesis and NO signaling
MRKEEMILFPYIKKLEDAVKHNLPKPVPHFGTVENPINMMIHEHDSAGNNFTPPGHACNTYWVLYAKLKEFYEDLMLHIHLENNILFPKAIQLEQKQ